MKKLTKSGHRCFAANSSEADTLSLFGGGDIDEIDDTLLEDMEDGDSDNASLLSAINSFLSCSQDTGRQLQVALLR